MGKLRRRGTFRSGNRRARELVFLPSCCNIRLRAGVKRHEFFGAVRAGPSDETIWGANAAQGHPGKKAQQTSGEF